uniref:SH3-containing GRB2-like protein 3-interacting protein 1 n=1 Tax=Catharus ustulatus TaxID=91951 RepID=A0A8C3TQJ6_CATUS
MKSSCGSGLDLPREQQLHMPRSAAVPSPARNFLPFIWGQHFRITKPLEQPTKRKFLNCAAPTKGKHFYSSSESEEEEEAHKKFNIKIKPLQAKDALRSAATVDELRASVGNIALSPSPVVSPALCHPPATLPIPRGDSCPSSPSSSPRGSSQAQLMVGTARRALTAPSVAGSSSPARPGTPLATCGTPPPPPPRPPSRPKLPPGKPPVSDVVRAEGLGTPGDSQGTAREGLGTPGDSSSRGPSPLTMGAQDTLPVAAAFTETVNAYFKGADPNKCIVKITGEMVLSFPAGITRHFATNPAPAVLTFRVLNFNRLEHVLPNPQLLCCDNVQSDSNSKEFWVNMPNLMTHLKKVSEQKPQATYYNVDMLKYQVSAQGIQSTPLNLAVSWRCDPASTDLRIDYKYNTEAMTAPVALNNVQFLVPVDGGVTKLQAVLPPAVWNAEQQRILWKIPDISQKSENGGVGSLLARFQLAEGPSSPAPLAVQFTSEGSTLSSCDIELVGPGYRFSLIKKRFAAGKYLADN